MWRTGLVLACAVIGCGADRHTGEASCADVEALRLNQIQVVGSHNSYRRRTYPPLFAHVQSLAACLSAELDPENWDYDHPPLREQLDVYGVRALEIDIFNDPDGGRFYERRGLRWIGAPGLVGRLVFASALPGDPHAAVVIANSSIRDQAAIADLVRRGYVVRTMADGGTLQARSGDVRSRDAALASGAQIVSTDYYRPDPPGAVPGSGWTNYEVTLPGGGPARPNPINAAVTAGRVCD